MPTTTGRSPLSTVQGDNPTTNGSGQKSELTKIPLPKSGGGIPLPAKPAALKRTLASGQRRSPSLRSPALENHLSKTRFNSTPTASPIYTSIDNVPEPTPSKNRIVLDDDDDDDDDEVEAAITEPIENKTIENLKESGNIDTPGSTTSQISQTLVKEAVSSGGASFLNSNTKDTVVQESADTLISPLHPPLKSVQGQNDGTPQPEEQTPIQQKGVEDFKDDDQPIVSLLDTENVMLTPNSFKKYSEREWRDMTKKIYSEASKEAALLNDECENLQSQLTKEKQTQDELRRVLNEYEKTISSMIAEKSKATEKYESDIAEMRTKHGAEVERLNRELNQARESYDDLSKRHENMKSYAQSFKDKEEQLKESLRVSEADLKVSEQRYATLKSHAETKLKNAGLELEKMEDAFRTETAALRAKVKQLELSQASMKDSLAAKEKENKELMTICDDLIAKMDQK
eukprot:Clim_evm104s152 gene=Clim_evmTU104s152